MTLLRMVLKMGLIGALLWPPSSEPPEPPAPISIICGGGKAIKGEKGNGESPRDGPASGELELKTSIEPEGRVRG